MNMSMSGNENKLQRLEKTIGENPSVQFAVLVGSRARQSASPKSDWDIAIMLCPTITAKHRFEVIETLRMQLAHSLDVTPDMVDLIDLHGSGLAMRAQVANDGVIVFEGDGLAFCQFCVRVWHELENFAWESRNAA